MQFSAMPSATGLKYQNTHVITVDIESAHPSMNRLFLWTQLRRMGFGGAGLRFLIKLLGANAARLGGLPNREYTPRTEGGRESGIPEGFGLSAMLFAVFSRRWQNTSLCWASVW